MPKTEAQVAIGQRMHAAAVQAGQSAYEIAEHLGVRHVTVYRWWWGSAASPPECWRAHASTPAGAPERRRAQS